VAGIAPMLASTEAPFLTVVILWCA